MKRRWTEEKLIERWTLFPDELALLSNKSGATRLGFAVFLRFFAREGRFPREEAETPGEAVRYVAEQAGISADEWPRYDPTGRAARYHRAEIRGFFGFRECTSADGEGVAEWLAEEVLPHGPDAVRVREAFFGRCRSLNIEPPTEGRIERLIASASRRFEDRLCASVFERVPAEALLKMEALLTTGGAEGGVDDAAPRDPRRSVLAWVRSDPGRVGLESVLEEVGKLRRVRELGLPADLFSAVSTRLVKTYRDRAATEAPSELRAHPAETRTTLVAALCLSREREITDSLVDLLVGVVHKMGVRAVRRVEKDLLEDLRRVNGKTNILFRVAEAAVESPDGLVREVLFPVVGEQTLRDLAKESKSAGPSFRLNVHARIVASYKGHYRRMLPPILEALEFRSNNADHRTVVEALELVRAYAGSRAHAYDEDPEEDVPVEGVVPPGWLDLVVRPDGKGRRRVERVGYELCVLNALRDGLRRREIWVAGADRYRDPDDDLPRDFDERRESYYEELGQPLEADRFVGALREKMRTELALLDEGMSKNPAVRVSARSGGRIRLSPLKPRPEPPNLGRLKGEVGRRWAATSLLDILKEADLRVGFTGAFASAATREILDGATLQRRLLLCLYGLGTNAGLKRMSSSDPESTYRELRYVRQKYVTREHLRAAITLVANAIFGTRRPEVWGEATTACASDSKKFGAWDQNLMTEWHIRYGGRGVMIYWHVQRKSVCVYSQLKSASSSEVAAMIEGVLRHCTDMTVEKNFVDSHGQSEVAFAFSRLLGFELMPRLKNMKRQKLYRPDKGRPDAYPNVSSVLTRPIDWDLIRNQYDQMVRYASALKSGTADAESILRRFSRGAPGGKGSPMHPTYRALAELGKVLKTVFLCRYLASEPLRREVHEGLNTIERWNSGNSFIFFGKGGEVATNRLEDQEASVLSLHLLQICLVYVNTLMIQRVLEEPACLARMAPEDLSALTPLIFAHVNPYGAFELDMRSRIPLEGEAAS